MAKQKISDVLQTLVESTSDEVTVADIIKKFEDIGFGPLLLIPSLLALLPTGGIPGVPSICGITLFFVCMQIAFGRSHPWLPGFIKQRSISHDKLENAVEKVLPMARKVETILTPRFEAITTPPWSRITAFYSGLISLCMIPLEALPFAVAVPAFALSVTALGITSRDGMIVLTGIVLQTLTGYLLFQLM